MTSEVLTATIKGHVLLKDKVTGEVLLDKGNAVHPRNMAVALARGLSNEQNHQVYKIKFGNGGSTVDTLGNLTFQPPNTTGANADLYNPTYEEIVDNTLASTPAENSVTYQTSDTDTTSIVVCSATISAGEPADQMVSDKYEFDELGLFTSDGLLLTHMVFSPILKTSEREYVITYDLTIAVE